jgi:hypothetical protein
MFKSEDRVVAGVTYRISQVPVDDGLEVGVCIARAIGPALLAVMQGDSLATIDKGALGEAIAKLSAQDLKFLCKTFAAKTFILEVPNKMPRLDNVWDTHFAGRYKALLGWLAACIQINYPDFLGFSASGMPATSASAAPAPSS